MDVVDLYWPRRGWTHQARRSCGSFHPAFSPACVAKNSQSGEGFQVCVGRGERALIIDFFALFFFR